MARFNVQHPETKLWRCYSTVVDNWVSEWLPEDEYKDWLIQETIEQLKFEWEHYGLNQHMPFSYNEAVFTAARMTWRNTHCESCDRTGCDSCKVYAYDWKSYLECDDDFLGCKADLIPEE